MTTNIDNKQKFVNNSRLLFTNLKQEIGSFTILLKDISYFPILPILLPIIITMVMFLPQNVLDTLRLHLHEPQWWQLLTNTFIHLNFDHYWSNITALVLFLVIQLIFVTLINENKRYYLLLLVTVIVVPIISSLIELYYTSINLPFYTNTQTSCGFSGVIFAILGFIPVLSLVYFSKLVKKNLLNLLTLLAFILYIAFAFIFMAYLFTHSYLLEVYSIIALILMIIMILGIILFHGRVYKNALLQILTSFDSHFILNTSWLILVLLFITIPWQLLPSVFVVSGGLVDFIVHFFGFIMGVIISYFVFSPLIKEKSYMMV